MAEAVTFDDLEGGSSDSQPENPIWTLDLNPESPDYSEKKVLEWLKGELSYLRAESSERFEAIKRNLQLYKGLQYLSQTARTDTRDKNAKQIVEKIVINELWDLTQNKVSRLIKYKPAIAVLPHDDEQGDKIAAKANKALLDHIWYVQNYEEHVEREAARYAKIMGEVFLWVEWDANRGDLHPSAKKLLDEGKEEIELLDEEGKPVTGPDGKPIMVSTKKRVGDVRYLLETPFTSFMQRVNRIENVEYCFRVETLHIEKAKRKYPELGNHLKPQTLEVYDFEKMEIKTKPKMVEIIHFYHLPTDELCEGAYIVFSGDKIAAIKKYPYSHKDAGVGGTDLPFERLTDEDVPEELPGRSFLERVKGISGTVNNITNMILRNQILVSHPKWMLPSGSAELSQLGNDITIVRFKGPIAPTLVQANPTPSEVFNFREILKAETKEKAGLGPITRGEPPPGIKAFVALQYLGEQENDRANEETVKFNAFRRNVARKTLGTAGDYYDPSDDRFIRMQGKNKSWMSVKYDAANLRKGYDVTIQNTSALPQERSARNQTLMELKEAFPALIPDEQFLDMLGFSQSEKFMDVVTVAVQAAELENEELMDGKKVQDPVEYENLIVHWRIHARQVQEYAFKHQTDPAVREKFIDHVRATEMLMAERARKNPLFAQKLMELELYPLFYVDEKIAEPSPEDEETGQAEVQPGQVPPLADPKQLVSEQMAKGALPELGQGMPPEAEVGPNGAPPEANASQEDVGKPAL